MLLSDERATSTAITHAITLGITTLLLLGLVSSIGGHLDGAKEAAARDELQTIGNRLAMELSQVDDLGQNGGNVTVRTRHPMRVVGQRYRVELNEPPDCEGSNWCLDLSTYQLDAAASVPLHNETALSIQDVGSGRFRLHSSGISDLPVSQSGRPDNRISRQVGVGKDVGVNPFGTVLQSSNDPPKPTFSVSPQPPTSGRNVTFNASDSYDPDGSIVAHQWDIDGDGLVDATGPTVTRQLQAGRYEVALEVRDDNSANTTVRRNVSVSGLEYTGKMAVLDANGDGDERAVSVTLHNNWSRPVTLTELFIDPENDAIDSLAEGGSGSEIEIDVGDDGSVDAYVDYSGGTSIPDSGYIADLDQYDSNADVGSDPIVPANTEVTLTLFEFDAPTSGERFEFGVRHLVSGAANVTSFTDTAGGPGISNYRLESSGQDVDLVFDATDELATITTTYGGEVSGTLARGDFSETVSGSTYTYRADISTGSDGTFWANTTVARNTGGTASPDVPLNDSRVVITGNWIWSTAPHWNANADERGVVHDSFGDPVPETVTLGYPAWDRGGSNLVGYWPLDGETGGPAEDVTGGNDGTIVDSPVQGSVGLHDTTSYTFVGDDEYVNVSSTNRLRGGPNAKVTASAWFNPHAPAGDSDWASIVGKQEDDDDGDWGLVVRDTCPSWAVNGCDGIAGDGNGPYIGYYGGENDDYGLFYGPIKSGQWQHAAITLDGANDTVQVYLNGELVAEDTGAPDDVSASTTHPVEIGATTYRDHWWYSFWNDPYFDGQIEDVRVYDRPLSGDQIRDLYDASANGTFTSSWQSGNTVDPSGLRLSYDVDIDPGERVNVTVVSDAGEESEVVELADGSGTVNVPSGTLSTNTDTYRLRVALNTSAGTHSPVVNALSLEEP